MPNDKVVSLVQYDVNRFNGAEGPEEEWEMDGQTTFTDVVEAYKSEHPDDAEAIERFAAFAMRVAGAGLDGDDRTVEP